MITLSEAAARTGKSRQAIHKAIRAGRVRAEKDGNGQLLIDPASLATTYRVDVTPVDTRTLVDSAARAASHAAERIELEVLRTKVAHLEAVAADLREERTRWQAEADHWRGQAQRLLTDQRTEPEAVASPPRRRWWRWALFLV